MPSRRSYESEERVRRSKCAAAGCVLLAGLLLACPAFAGSAPDWLHDLARRPLPPFPDDTRAVQLLRQQVTTVKDNGEILILHRAAFRILRPEGRAWGTLRVSFDNETRIESIKAWCIPAQGKDYEVKEGDAVESSMFGGGVLYQDDRVKELAIPAADPGNVIGYEYLQRARPYVLQDIWGFQNIIPVLTAIYTLQLPPGWEMSAYWQNHPAVAPLSPGGNGWSWELHDIPPIDVEERATPRLQTLVGRMLVVYRPSRSDLQSETIGSWKALGEWYLKLTAGRRDPSPAIKQKVQELTAGQATTLDKIRALAAFAQRDVRYVEISLGIGGYQPHPAADIYSNRYGDCKDKATVLSSMLSVLGVDSYYVILNDYHGGVEAGVPFARGFDHAILAIRLPQDVPATGLYATYDDARLGKLLFFDPTNAAVPLGLIPEYEEGNRVVLVTPEGGELVQMPMLAPKLNRFQRTGKFTLAPDGTLSGSVEEVYSGPGAGDLRLALLQLAKSGRKEAIEDYLGSNLPGFTLRGIEIGNLEQYDTDLTIRYQFTADRYAKTAGNLLLLRPRVLGQKAQDFFRGKERKYPVQFEAPTLQTDAFEITLPPGFTVDDLPSPADLDAGFASYKSQIEVKGNVLRYSRQYEIKDILVPTEQLPRLKTFYRQVAGDENASAVLKRSN